MKFKIRRCKLADYENYKSRRQYLHVGHIPGFICKALAFDKIPLNHQLALLLHELGHLVIEKEHGEEEANEAAKEISGITIKYIPITPWGNRLQFIPSEDLKRVYKTLKTFIEESSLKYFRPSELVS